MSGARTFLCMQCGDEFIWAVAYSRHLNQCKEPLRVELIAAYGRVIVDGSGCWLWGRKLNKEGGYPSSSRFGYMHRLMYVTATGDSDIDGLDICHQCDTPPCVNPMHLFKGTRQVNMLDGVEKNGHWTDKLSDIELAEWKNSTRRGRQLQAEALRKQSNGGDA